VKGRQKTGVSERKDKLGKGKGRGKGGLGKHLPSDPRPLETKQWVGVLPGEGRGEGSVVTQTGEWEERPSRGPQKGLVKSRGGQIKISCFYAEREGGGGGALKGGKNQKTRREKLKKGNCQVGATHRGEPIIQKKDGRAFCEEKKGEVWK